MSQLEAVDLPKIADELFQLIQSAAEPVLVGSGRDVARQDCYEAAFLKVVEGIKRVRAVLPADLHLADCGPQERTALRQLNERIDQFEDVYVTHNDQGILEFPADDHALNVLIDSLKRLRSFVYLVFSDPETNDKDTEAQISTGEDAPFTVNEKNSQIRIDGEVYEVPPESARMAKILLDAKGEWLPMLKNGFTKASQTKSKLPEKVKEKIETSRGKGYRIKPTN